MSPENETRAGRAEGGPGAIDPSWQEQSGPSKTRGPDGAPPDDEISRAIDASKAERESAKRKDRGVPPPIVEAPKRFAGIAEVGLGWLLLPRAVVCGDPNTECERGDTTPTIEIWNLVRLPIGFAFGAGLTLGLIPTADVPPDNPPGVDRTHRRGYMTIEGIARYYPFQGETLEGWVGLGPGLVVVSDNFSSRAGLSENAYVGNPGVTLFTEGLSVMAAVGLSISLTEHWYLGAGLRGGVWRVPDTPAVSPLGDEASITGTNGVIYGGLSIAFRTKL